MTILKAPARYGFILALIVLMIDQGFKYVMIHVYDLPGRGRVVLTPFFDLVMVWNKGISYGLFQQDTALGRMVLLGITLLTVLALAIWLLRAQEVLLGLALGFIIGGALGNAIDRWVHGAVADFFSAHALGFHWYVFNLADAAIVAGVALLLYDTLGGGNGKGHSPPPKGRS
jgi:signal peptidase II